MANETEKRVPVKTMYIDVINLSNQSSRSIVCKVIALIFLVAMGAPEGLFSLYISFILYIYTVFYKFVNSNLNMTYRLTKRWPSLYTYRH